LNPPDNNNLNTNTTHTRKRMREDVPKILNFLRKKEELLNPTQFYKP